MKNCHSISYFINSLKRQNVVSRHSKLNLFIFVIYSLFSITACYNADFMNLNNQKNQSVYSYINSREGMSVLFNRRDLNLAEKFARSLKKYNGDWAGHGIQRIIRLNSDCSNNYVSLRHFRIRADVPSNEAFNDPFTLIEQQIYRKAMTLKSKQTNKYVCYNEKRGNFELKNLSELDKYCIFFYTIKKQNQYSFSIGSTRTIHLSFNKIGRSINTRINKRVFRSCPLNTNLFNLHSKSTDNIYSEKRPAPLVIVYEPKKRIKSFSLKNGYQSIFYSTLENNQVTPLSSTSTMTIKTTTTIKSYNIYEYLSNRDKFDQLLEVDARKRRIKHRRGNLNHKQRRRRRRKRRRKYSIFNANHQYNSQ